ncbi:hypothetical protein B0T25DRAFT_547826 [Lasiosphaeria hispida]|uniref:Uncharacterized protein n=1 Tax=Lasiosphaeria hispida TaxID=260671 RepID=A0AAJ0MC88_9PEZI|nr:hypothetical protein B0T25DRAFT_547826 [Lasiosphaeria hispida]
MHWAETTTRQFGSLMFCFVFPSFYQAADMDLWARGFTWEIPYMVSMGCIRICFRVPSTGPAAKGRGPSNILSFCGSAVFQFRRKRFLLQSMSTAAKNRS